MDADVGQRGVDRLESHVIAPAQVHEWLADSYVRTVVYHRTTALAADSIREQGVRIERSEHGSFGLGFYTATSVVDLFGDTDLTVAIRVRNPLIGEIHEVAEFVDELGRRIRPPARGRMNREVSAAVRLELLGLGYDSIVVLNGGGDGVDYVIALLAESVKVVLDP